MSFKDLSSSIRVLFWFSSTATRFSRHLTYSFFFRRHSRAASLEATTTVTVKKKPQHLGFSPRYNRELSLAINQFTPKEEEGSHCKNYKRFSHVGTECLDDDDYEHVCGIRYLRGLYTIEPMKGGGCDKQKNKAKKKKHPNRFTDD